MTPSEWLQANLSDVIVAVAVAGASLAGSTAAGAGTPSAATPEGGPMAHLKAGSQDG